MCNRRYPLLLAILLWSSSGIAGPLRAGTLLAIDRNRGVVLAIDQETGQQEVISGAGEVGDGPSLELPRRIVISPEQRIFVLGYRKNPIVEVDPRTGDRRVVLGIDAGDDQDCCGLRGLVLEGDRYLVSADRSTGRLRRIDLETGEHYTFGPYLGRDHGPIDMVPASKKGWYLSGLSPDVIRYIDAEASYNNPLTSLLADGGYVGPGLTLLAPASIAMSDEGTLYSISLGNFLYSILAFDVETGDRWLVTGSNSLDYDGWENPNERGAGPALTSNSSIAVGLDGYLYATAPQTGLFRIDPQTGDRELIAEITGLSGLAVVPVPEPLTMTLVCIGFLAAHASAIRS